MYARKSKTPTVVTIIILCSAVLFGGYLGIENLNSEIKIYEDSKARSTETFSTTAQDPFINTAAYEEPNVTTVSRDDALYYYRAPEGFVIISHSEAWDYEMLDLLYQELKLNTHGDEIKSLHEIVVYPHEDDEMSALATYSPDISTINFHLRFPAFPSDFSVDFPIYTGIIEIFGGDTNTTIESIAESLSHEYGHHYTFHYMFDNEMRLQGSLDTGEYGRLREARRYDLIPTLELGANYEQLRHRYIIEIAAEDYVTLMGSPTTRQVVDYYDVKQLTDDPELERSGVAERNAFPQENMSIPLAIDIQGLNEYFHSFIDTPPRVPVEEKQTIALQLRRESERFDLESGAHTFVYYVITWNTPYADAIYTLACYDPYEYTGRGIPIKTVRPGSHSGGSASAVVGEYFVQQDRSIRSIDDGLAEGVKVFYVTAQLPDGTYYVSELHEVNFG